MIMGRSLNVLSSVHISKKKRLNCQKSGHVEFSEKMKMQINIEMNATFSIYISIFCILMPNLLVLLAEPLTQLT